MEIQIGQKVSYPNQGVCLVEDIEKKVIGGTEMTFYALRILSDNSIILVPTANAESVGLRPIISTVQCKTLINKLSTDFEPVSEDWKTRSRDFTAKLQTGDLFEAADVLKKLSFLAHEKKLSFREQTLLDKSKFLIVSEVSNANASDETELKAKVERLIETACKKHSMAQEGLAEAQH